MSLLQEGTVIQQRLRKSRSGVTENKKLSKRFSDLMFQGKIKSAIKLLNGQLNKGGILPLDQEIEVCGDRRTVRDVSLEKHPEGAAVKPKTLVNPSDSSTESYHPIIFDAIDGEYIRKTALKVDGGAGPSGVDAKGWRRFCTSFRRASDDLCTALASLAKRICTTHVDPACLAPFTACRLIALDKCPGVRPIGIGEVMRRIIGKAVIGIITPDILKVTGSIQLCTGQDAGIESAIHAMNKLFKVESTEATLLIDATNAFNILNREAALRNINSLCPSLATIAINTYRENTQLFIDGETIWSREGTTQRDPLSMAIYAVGIMPLIQKMTLAVRDENLHQIWFADDASAAGSLSGLHGWWSSLIEDGPAYGYHVNASKTWLITKSGLLSKAKEMFQDTGIHITEDGQQHLGATLGSGTFIDTFTKKKIARWTELIISLAEIAKSHPHAAYCGFVHGLSNQWSFTMRTVPGIEDLFQPIEEAIRYHLIPALTGRDVSEAERQLLSLPTRLGGLGLANPTHIASNEYAGSVKVTAPLVELINEKQFQYCIDTVSKQRFAKYEVKVQKRKKQTQSAEQLRCHLPSYLQRAMDLGQEKGASSWLSAIPVQEHGFALHKGDFRDALCLRYNWHPTHLPTKCACGHAFSVNHAMDCRTGGFPTRRHNEIRDITAEIMSEVCYNVMIEPQLQSLSGETFRRKTTKTEDNARLDISADAFWGTEKQSIFRCKDF